AAAGTRALARHSPLRRRAARRSGRTVDHQGAGEPSTRSIAAGKRSGTALRAAGLTPPLQPARSVDGVRQIGAISNPVIRNLRITDCYSRLAAAFAARSGGGANWCTYATW